jgi:hypothetical protein
MLPHIHCVIPGLFQPLALWRQDFAFEPMAPHLLRLCANARHETSPVSGLENTLFHALGHPAGAEIPFAHYRYQLDFGVPPEQPVMCADPVFLQSGINQVLLYPELPRLAVGEVETLLVLLNRHLAEDGLQLVAKHPQRWYLLGEGVQDRPQQTVPLSQALGQGIFPLLPQGNHRYWHRLLNEIQMLLHTSGIENTNALWLWGMSNPASLPPLQKGGWGGFLGTSDNAQVMALATNTICQPANTFTDCEITSGNYQLILEDLLQPSITDGMQVWQQVMDSLEENWFAPLLAGMKSGKFSVSLTSCDGRILHCQAPGRWKFWQFKPASWQQLTG